MVPSSAAADRRRNLSLRILSGLALAPPVLVLAYLGGKWFGVAMAAGAAIALREWFRIVLGRPLMAGYVAFATVMLVYWLYGAPGALVALAGLTALFALVGRAGHQSSPVFAALGLPYVGLTMVGLPWLRDVGDSAWQLVFFVFLTVWATDIGAFVVGRIVGGPRLAPSISPNKTWSGLVGGIVAAALIAFAWAAIFHARVPAYAIVIAIGLSLAGQGGDLFESSVKRRFQLKDSGGLIPGHGGLLDRIDGLLWAVPSFALLHAFGGTTGLMP
ncbi:MAG TPA: phosphatidate cytidylyltransferase [Alphaproteobacteria bacterium]|nr:phosphatidate cytidylyltransferase [Alphaproteobacteria bacterium]